MDLPRGASPALSPGGLSLSFDDYRTSQPASEVGESAESNGEQRPLPARRSVAATLPTEVILQILYYTDPETFVSLVLVNRVWRKAADHHQVYAYQLSRCPSNAGTEDVCADPKEKDLPTLKRYLAQEAKRNLFAAFLRPQQTILNLVSTTTSAAAAFPQGEGFEFFFSHRAQYCLAISSSRIVVLNTKARTPYVVRELKVVRRPLSACIRADGSLLAVLAANHRINLYDLTQEHVMFKRSLELSETAHTITMTIGGEILAAGCESGVEVVSLSDKGPQAQKRMIKCDRIDNLAFSTDGTMLLGTTQAARSPSTVILTAPYFTDFSEHEMDRTELLSHLWTSQIIFPNSSRDCSHAALLPRSQDHDANWTLAYDRVFESFRAVRSDDLRNGTTYFTGPDSDQTSPRQLQIEQRQREKERTKRAKTSFTPRTLPAITQEGELVAAAFLTSDIWLYGVPEDLENPRIKIPSPRTTASTSETASTSRSPLREVDRLPRWQLLVDKYRNVFAKGRKVASVTGASNLCWSTPEPSGESPLRYDRLVVAAPGGVSDASDLPDAELASVDGGRLVFLDFHFGSLSGKSEELTIEVGNVEPELLEEENMDMEEEIAVVRRRTLARREGASRLTVSSVADVLRPVTIAGAPPVPPVPAAAGFGLDRADTDESAPSPDDAHAPQEVDHDVDLEGLGGPYSSSGPRSRETVYRSSAAVEANRRRNPPTRATEGPAEFRRTDGTELPHESDADNWVPPPPAYGDHVGDDRPPQDVRRRSAASQDGATSQLSERPVSTSAPRSSARGSRISGVSQLSPINVRKSLISQVSSGPSTNPPHSIGSQPSPNAPMVSPMSMQSSNVAPRRRVETDHVPQSTIESRRRSAADIEGTRWFSRHQENRTASPALADDEFPKRSASQRNSPPASTYQPARRPVSSYTPRSPLYRAALQPASEINPIPEPGVTRNPPPSVRISPARDSPPSIAQMPVFHARLEQPLPSPPDPEQLAAVAGRDRSVSPVRPEETVRHRASAPVQPRPPSQRESSAWASNAERIATTHRHPSPPPLEPRFQPNRKSQRILGLGRFGASTPQPSTSATPTATSPEPGPVHPRAHRASVDSPLSTPPKREKSLRRRSLRFIRRPRTEDPAVLAAAAPEPMPIDPSTSIAARSMVASVHAAGAPAPPSLSSPRTRAHTQSMVEPLMPSASGYRGWERRPLGGDLAASTIPEHSVHGGGPPSNYEQRSARMSSRPGTGASYPNGRRRKTMCMVM